MGREKVGSLGAGFWSRNFVRINIDREHRVAYGMSDGNGASGTKFPRGWDRSVLIRISFEKRPLFIFFVISRNDNDLLLAVNSRVKGSPDSNHE